jgi:LmbE family N-acetylglucosaminyl deacetylase/SAM-dependent methyltransferase
MNSFSQNGDNSRCSNSSRSGDDVLSAQGPHLFFSPHADDVVLSCGGTIHSLISQNKSVKVVGVFAGMPVPSEYSAFARHLHRKWDLQSNPITERWREDTVAMKELGVNKFERWDFVEAPYRTRLDGSLLYLGNEELVGVVAEEDQTLRDRIAQAMRKHLGDLAPTAVLYFPLSLGKHVDHQILFDIGLELAAFGRQVRFYEDYPYSQAYELDGTQAKWRAHVVPIVLKTKLRAACAYTSQLRGLGGSPSLLEKRLQAYGAAVGGKGLSERYWQIATNGTNGSEGQSTNIAAPLARKEVGMRLRDFGKFLKTFRWHDLDEVLPLGDGICLDVGCGAARHRELVQARGYKWIGIDRRDSVGPILWSDASSLPLATGSAAAVVAWQVFEYVEQPEHLVAEVARVVEPGGVFCGSVSFLEPVHGHTYFNLSPLILKRLLARHGFGDIEVKPGLNGIALVLWTWLSRSGIPFAANCAIPLAVVALVPLAAILFFASWLRRQLVGGSGHTMRWLTETGPLEFAGHVMFVARKTARARTGALGSWQGNLS